MRWLNENLFSLLLVLAVFGMIVGAFSDGLTQNRRIQTCLDQGKAYYETRSTGTSSIERGCKEVK